MEIQARGASASQLEIALDAAYQAIERVQNLMSVHEPKSELSRVNAEAALHSVAVSADTFEILRRGLELSDQSNGTFDFTVAPLLARWGLLPQSLGRCDPGGWRDVELLPRQRVRFARPLAIDLGGIAKGFAVDAAIEILLGLGISSAGVNAGGDVRVFGPEPSEIHLRHPTEAYLLDQTLLLTNAALATSAPCFTQRRWRRLTVSHLVAPRSGDPITGGISVTVKASQCWLADALTKIVLNDQKIGERLLAHYSAEAVVLTA